MSPKINLRSDGTASVRVRVNKTTWEKAVTLRNKRAKGVPGIRSTSFSCPVSLAIKNAIGHEVMSVPSNIILNHEGNGPYACINLPGELAEVMEAFDGNKPMVLVDIGMELDKRFVDVLKQMDATVLPTA